MRFQACLDISPTTLPHSRHFYYKKNRAERQYVCRRANCALAHSAENGYYFFERLKPTNGSELDSINDYMRVLIFAFIICLLNSESPKIINNFI
jgi:hypothetical protein